MAGPLDVQRFPFGALDLLGLKGSGQMPTRLEDQLRGNIDLTQFYLNSLRARVVGTTAVVNAPGWFPVAGGALVPPTEIWAVVNVTVFPTPAALGAGEAYTVSPAYSRTSIDAPNVLPIISTGSGVTARPSAGFQLDSPVFLFPNFVWGLWAHNVTAGASTWTCSLDYFKLSI
jgi:hypothetical protein